MRSWLSSICHVSKLKFVAPPAFQAKNVDDQFNLFNIIESFVLHFYFLTRPASFLICFKNQIQGLDALGLATMETAAARVPFSSFFYSPLMTKEDIINLRNFRRLMLLLLGARRKEESSTVRFLFYLKRTTSIHFIIMYYFHFEGHLTFYLKFNLGSKDLSILMLKPIGLHTTLYYTKSRN